MAYPTTWLEAIRDPYVPIHWLLTLQAGDATFRFADTNLTIGSDHYLGALQVTGQPSQSVDPYTQRASAATATVKLAPIPDEPGPTDSLRPYDLAAIRNTAFVAMKARLSLWAEGTPLAEQKVRLSGYANRPEIGQDGSLTLYLEDWSTRRNRKFPTRRIDVEDRPYARADDRAKGRSIVLNKAIGIECPCIIEAALSGGGASYFMICADATSSNVAVYRGSSDETAYCVFASGGTDVNGDTISFFSIGSGRPASTDRFTFWGLGPVDPDGYFQGSAGALITNPVSEIWYLAVKWGGIPHQLINEAHFRELRNDHALWEANIQIGPDDETTFFDVVEGMSRPMWTAFFVEGDMLTGRRLRLDAESVMHLRNGEILRGLTVKPDDDEHLLTKFTVKFNWSWSHTDEELSYRESARRDTSSSLRFANIRKMLRNGEDGELDREETLETKMFSEAASMEYTLNMAERMHGEIHSSGTATATREAHALRLYDTIELTHPRAPSTDGAGWAAKRAIVTGLTWARNGVEIEWLAV